MNCKQKFGIEEILRKNKKNIFFSTYLLLLSHQIQFYRLLLSLHQVQRFQNNAEHVKRRNMFMVTNSMLV